MAHAEIDPAASISNRRTSHGPIFLGARTAIGFEFIRLAACELGLGLIWDWERTTSCKDFAWLGN